ncbi:MAG: sodium:alanine symporter family protein, partial [Verrucomicrobia bacterium]|nr:sodium:alanine symporter family protein [Verrucomicrobiota bacterium]
AILASFVILGGVERIAKVAASVVPVMALLYLGAGALILSLHSDAIIPAFWTMIKSAFQGSSFVGGVMGFTVVKALSTGFERGIFATDAGTGIVPILQSGARTKDIVVNGIATLVAPFLVMIICSMTGLILVVTGACDQIGLASTNMVVFAFSQVFGNTGGLIIVLSALFLFAYTTIIAWGGCAERAAEFLWDRKKVKLFQYLYLALIPVGAVARVDFVWVFADLSISLMLITNLIGIMGLRKEIIAETKRYFFPPVEPVPIKIDEE